MSRLVLIGVAQLVLLTLAAAAIVVAQGPPDPPDPARVITSTRIADLESRASDPVQLRQALELIDDEDVAVSVYDAWRRLVASSVDPPLAMPPPPSDGRQNPPPSRHGPSAVFGLALPDGRGYLVARGRPRHGFATLPLLVLAFDLVILAAGAVLTARWIARPLERLSRQARAIGAGDLTARSHFDRADEIGELGARMDEMAERVARLLAAEKELLANVAHELRTPLARIGVALDLAGEGNADVARVSLAEIAVDVTELVSIVDDVLTTIRFDIAAEDSPLRRVLTRPSDISDAAAGRLRARHSDRRLIVEVTSDLPTISVEPVLFRRVLDNLLENAHKYSPDGDTPIELRVTRAADGVAFEVRDRGVGIPPEDLPRVFTAFFRGDRSRSRETGGVGLGLTLAKRIVDAHDGTVAVSSVVGEGTTVVVVIPAAA